MATEGNQDMTPQNSQPAGPEHAEKAPQAPKLEDKRPATRLEKPSLAQRQAYVREYFERANKGKVVSVDEKRIQEEIIERGLLSVAGGTTGAPPDGEPPPPPPAEARAAVPAGEPEGQRPSAGREGAARRSIFEGIQEPDFATELASEARIRGRPLTQEEVETFTESFNARLASLRPYREAIERADRDRVLDIEEQYRNLNEAIRRGEVSAIDADQYLVRLAQRGAVERARLTEDQLRQRFPERVQAERIIRETEPIPAEDTPEQIEEKRQMRTERLKELIDDLDPDTQLDPVTLGIIARYEEVAEKFLDKIISKPLATPAAHYELSFYASINLQTFFTEVRRINPPLYKRYAEVRESTLRFHEMNRSILSESGNIDAFLGITRTVTPGHLDVTTKIEGVELVRQLTDQAYGRFYAKSNRVDEKDFEPEINDWVSRQFHKQVSEGVVRSKYNRSLEQWEIDRALAFGRNTHASFYRHSELLSWSHIPEAGPSWLKSVPTETVVRVLAGAKWLSYRFRIGEVGGGTEFTALLYDRIRAEYKDNKEDESKNLRLEKIGKLDILKDIAPVRFLRGAGFDSGWRTLNAYLGSDIMNIQINPDDFPSSVQPAIKEYIKEEGLPEAGGKTNLGKFLIWQEQKVRETFARDARETKVGNVTLPIEHRPTNSTEVGKRMSEITGVLLRPGHSQLNLCLGVLIKNIGNADLRTHLWEKTADLLPLRVAYLLSEDFVKHFEGYESVKGEEGNLFSDEFESKLIKAQRLRIQEQKKDTTIEVGLERFLDEAGMTDTEKQIVADIRRSGKEQAPELAKIVFPHTPFLDDVPFENADYITLGAEVFPRRMGGDFRAYFEANTALNAIVGGLDQPYPQILENVKKIKDALSGPEGPITAQDIALPIVQSYLKLAEQWVWTRWIPFAKTVRGVLNLPTSWLQVKFGKDALSADESTMNQMINQAIGVGTIRREKLPGETESQFDKAAKHVGARPINVLIDQARTLSVIIAFILMGSFISKLAKGERG